MGITSHMVLGGNPCRSGPKPAANNINAAASLTIPSGPGADHDGQHIRIPNRDMITPISLNYSPSKSPRMNPLILEQKTLREQPEQAI